jgi:ketosteroid isomerase-like protein
MTMDPAEEFRTITMKKFAEAEQALRATHVWRREDGEWKIVHRHGDTPPADNFSSQDH